MTATMKIFPARTPIRGAVVVPGSKSLSNRYLLLAAAARGESRVSGLLDSDDVQNGSACVEALGAALTPDGDAVKVQGVDGKFAAQGRRIYLGAAGTLARFLPGLLAAADGEKFTLEASSQLAGRPIDGLAAPLRMLGARIETPKAASFPMTIDAVGLNGGEAVVDGSISSQFVSGLLMAAPLARGPVHVRSSSPIVQADYVRLTTQAMTMFGARVETEADGWRVFPTRYAGAEVAVEADASTASYFAALAAATAGEVTITNLSLDTGQPDIRFLQALERMGARIVSGKNGVTVSGPSRLSGGFEIDFQPMSDTALTLAALAPFADKPIRITGIKHIRRHESDRVAAMAAELRRAGVPAQEYDDGWLIEPASPKPVRHETYDDHRMAMALAVMAARGEGAELDNPGCVAKTCPRFFELIGMLGVRCEAR